jgi:pilus assembly protein Flp/PilA
MHYWVRVPGVLDAPILSWRNEMKKLLYSLWKEESGQDLTEYALLLVLVALAAIASMKTLATAIANVYSTAATDLAVTT